MFEINASVEGFKFHLVRMIYCLSNTLQSVFQLGLIFQTGLVIFAYLLLEEPRYLQLFKWKRPQNNVDNNILLPVAIAYK
ncbi:hypothetical protein GQX74_015421 [Glossina fuscipes]|nr:hypothetical protein GQX74_015421 [Glossina fuscipes]